jgi:hypothetical protein
MSQCEMSFKSLFKSVTYYFNGPKECRAANFQVLRYFCFWSIWSYWRMRSKCLVGHKNIFRALMKDNPASLILFLSLSQLSLLLKRTSENWSGKMPNLEIFFHTFLRFSFWQFNLVSRGCEARSMEWVKCLKLQPVLSSAKSTREWPWVPDVRVNRIGIVLCQSCCARPHFTLINALSPSQMQS